MNQYVEGVSVRFEARLRQTILCMQILITQGDSSTYLHVIYKM